MQGSDLPPKPKSIPDGMTLFLGFQNGEKIWYLVSEPPRSSQKSASPYFDQPNLKQGEEVINPNDTGLYKCTPRLYPVSVLGLPTFYSDSIDYTIAMLKLFGHKPAPFKQFYDAAQNVSGWTKFKCDVIDAAYESTPHSLENPEKQLEVIVAIASYFHLKTQVPSHQLDGFTCACPCSHGASETKRLREGSQILRNTFAFGAKCARVWIESVIFPPKLPVIFDDCVNEFKFNQK
jgi:hypothetical protein